MAPDPETTPAAWKDPASRIAAGARTPWQLRSIRRRRRPPLPWPMCGRRTRRRVAVGQVHSAAASSKLSPSFPWSLSVISLCDLGYGFLLQIIWVLFQFCSLDDDIWDVRINLDGQDNIERSIGESDITYMNLLALIEGEGYGINDCMYYVREKGRGIAGMELLDGMSKVQQMVTQYENEKQVTLAVISGGSTLPPNVNSASVEEQIPISEIGNPVVYTVDDEGVILPSQQCTQLTEDPEFLYMLT